MNFLRQHKEKQKAKRTAERLAQYRDWPPDLVDTFLDWENARPTNPLFMADAPKGYADWSQGHTYDYYQSHPMNITISRWRH